MIKIFMHDKSVKLPNRGTSLSSGIDFYSPNDVTINSKSDVLIDLQVSILIPPGYELQMENKSGVSTKLKLLRGATIVDADYTYPNKIHAHLFNLDDKPVHIQKNQKIIQGIIRKVELWEPLFVEDENLMKRNGDRISGFGSTGA
jgi:deoxyuridine 5'-triphosphate nucleotidohydrolase